MNTEQYRIYREGGVSNFWPETDKCVEVWQVVPEVCSKVEIKWKEEARVESGRGLLQLCALSIENALKEFLSNWIISSQVPSPTKHPQVFLKLHFTFSWSALDLTNLFFFHTHCHHVKILEELWKHTLFEKKIRKMNIPWIFCLYSVYANVLVLNLYWPYPKVRCHWW